ncbi:hypothetical protein BLA23254_06912 [Burkholderia lata]|uniref:Uncharacterized protein n=2 Tax=Burkholderia lata (strain ATCC 17760 / DSM 23089 / LMG 22485 / NCIMB 9086 / R18194 / 383) TaxID=482957 RepID=A0A6P2S3H1_BURL3|nr:hypothetical protein BLA23254_06912 [Burkholderia lata]
MLDFTPILKYIHGFVIVLFIGLVLGSYFAFAAQDAAKKRGLSAREQKLLAQAALTLCFVVAGVLYWLVWPSYSAPMH